MKIFRINGVEISDKSDSFMLTSVSGDSGGSVKRSETTYVDTDGANIDDVLFQCRIVDINGFICCSSYMELERMKQTVLRAFNPKVKAPLAYYNGVRWYMANVIPDKLPSFVKVNNFSCTFTAYVNMYEYYWLSYNDIRHNVFQRINKVESPFTLPCMFTQRIAQADIINEGDVEAFPKIAIHCTDSTPDGTIVIKNHRNGQTLTLKHQLSLGEIVNIDCYNHTISSSISGNIIEKITPESEFIQYEQGINRITATGCGTSILSYHKNRYLGA